MDALVYIAYFSRYIIKIKYIIIATIIFIILINKNEFLQSLEWTYSFLMFFSTDLSRLILEGGGFKLITFWSYYEIFQIIFHRGYLNDMIYFMES